MGTGGVEGTCSPNEAMDATNHTLCKPGFANLTMQGFAAALAKSRLPLHLYYDTKEEPSEACLDRPSGWADDGLADSDAEHPVDRLIEFIDRSVLPSTEHDTRIALELRLPAVHNATFGDMLTGHDDVALASAELFIDNAVIAGVFVHVQAHWIGESVSTALVGVQPYRMNLDAGTASERMAVQL